MITPEMLKYEELKKIDFEKLEAEIDMEIKNNHGKYPWEYAIIFGDYPVEARNIIGKKYKDAGWLHVYHKTSAENDEKPGLTSFILSTIKIDDKYIKNYHTV